MRRLSDAAGRVRYDAPALRGDPALAVAVEDALDDLPGVRQAHAHPRSGALVVWYDAASHAGPTPRSTTTSSVS